MLKRVPFIPQFHQSECGLCVITMMLRYYGAWYSFQEVRKNIIIGRDGISIKTLIDTFANYGIVAKAYRGVIDNKSDIKLPAIVTWEENHYVILEKMTDKYIYIYC